MVNKHKKLWAHYEQVRMILGTYITLFFTVLILSLIFSCLANSAEINSGVQTAVKSALLSGLKWYAIIMSIVTVLFILWFVFYSDTVEFTDTSMKYYRWLFSKKPRNIFYNEITECVVVGRWWNNCKQLCGRRIILFNKSNVIIAIDIYSKLALMLALNLGEFKFRLVGENGNLNTASRYFNIDFESLSYEEQLIMLKYYCSFTKRKYKTGEELLTKKRKV